MCSPTNYIIPRLARPHMLHKHLVMEVVATVRGSWEVPRLLFVFMSSAGSSLLSICSLKYFCIAHEIQLCSLQTEVTFSFTIPKGNFTFFLNNIAKNLPIRNILICHMGCDFG